MLNKPPRNASVRDARSPNAPKKLKMPPVDPSPLVVPLELVPVDVVPVEVVPLELVPVDVVPV
ncbi:MAG: hypothetical protein QOD39_203, partial [Mycobacterium sp.]|nr:hypothetical protein [Mycobacterium sp.]